MFFLRALTLTSSSQSYLVVFYGYYLSEIYYAGGTVTKDISSKDLTNGIIQNGKQSLFFDTREELGEWVKNNGAKNDTILIMGARDDTLTIFAKEIYQHLSLKLKG